MGMRALIIGSGLAALMAAYELSEKCDAEIVVFSEGAGASPYVHGFNIPLYFGDSTQKFYEDTITSGCGLNNIELASKLCNESLSIINVLNNLGVEINKSNGEYVMLKALGSSYPRVISCGNCTGTHILNMLKKKILANKKVRFMTPIRALRIISDKGRVCGVFAYDIKNEKFIQIAADCVVLATGGFSGIYPFSTNSSDIGGDGIAMSYLAGAKLTDLEFVQFEPSVAVYPEKIKGKSVITTMFYEGAVLRNKHGDRFMTKYSSQAECVNKDFLSFCITKEVSEGRGTEHGGVFFDATGVDADTLHKHYSSYLNRYLAVGIDIRKEMFEIAAAAHTSLGGVVVDENGDTSLKGFFAAGEIIGGIHGANRIGGNAGLETLVFGRQAGVSASTYLSELETPHSAIQPCAFPTDIMLSTERIEQITQQMKALLIEDLSVIREHNRMEKAQNELSDLYDEIKQSIIYNGRGNSRTINIYKAIRLENDLLCALLLCKAALERRSSVGCHYIKDSAGESRLYNVFLWKDQNGEVNVSRKYR